MNILVLGGSPKGEKSVTMQYVNWLQKDFTQHRFENVQIAQPIQFTAIIAGTVSSKKRCLGDFQRL